MYVYYVLHVWEKMRPDMFLSYSHQDSVPKSTRARLLADSDDGGDPQLSSGCDLSWSMITSGKLTYLLKMAIHS